MKKFIELHIRGSDDKIIINMNHITDIQSANDGNGGTEIALIDFTSFVYVKEEYDAIKAFLISCDLL